MTCLFYYLPENYFSVAGLFTGGGDDNLPISCSNGF
jgi:hypothetical protein